MRICLRRTSNCGNVRCGSGTGTGGVTTLGEPDMTLV